MKWFACPLGLSLLLAFCGPSRADPPAIIQTQIKEIFTGWDAEQFGIFTVEPRVDPGDCDPQLQTHGYMTDVDQPGYHTFLAAALAAFAQRSTVQVIVSTKKHDCVAGHPKLIGLNIISYP